MNQQRRRYHQHHPRTRLNPPPSAPASSASSSASSSIVGANAANGRTKDPRKAFLMNRASLPRPLFPTHPTNETTSTTKETTKSTTPTTRTTRTTTKTKTVIDEEESWDPFANNNDANNITNNTTNQSLSNNVRGFGNESKVSMGGDTLFDHGDANDKHDKNDDTNYDDDDDDDDEWNNYGNSFWSSDTPTSKNSLNDNLNDGMANDDSWSNFRNVSKPVRVVDWPSSPQGTKSNVDDIAAIGRKTTTAKAKAIIAKATANNTLPSPRIPLHQQRSSIVVPKVPKKSKAASSSSSSSSSTRNVGDVGGGDTSSSSSSSSSAFPNRPTIDDNTDNNDAMSNTNTPQANNNNNNNNAGNITGNRSIAVASKIKPTGSPTLVPSNNTGETTAERNKANDTGTSIKVLKARQIILQRNQRRMKARARMQLDRPDGKTDGGDCADPPVPSNNINSNNDLEPSDNDNDKNSSIIVPPPSSSSSKKQLAKASIDDEASSNRHQRMDPPPSAAPNSKNIVEQSDDDDDAPTEDDTGHSVKRNVGSGNIGMSKTTNSPPAAVPLPAKTTRTGNLDKWQNNNQPQQRQQQQQQYRKKTGWDERTVSSILTDEMSDAQRLQRLGRKGTTTTTTMAVPRQLSVARPSPQQQQQQQQYTTTSITSRDYHEKYMPHPSVNANNANNANRNHRNATTTMTPPPRPIREDAPSDTFPTEDENHLRSSQIIRDVVGRRSSSSSSSSSSLQHQILEMKKRVQRSRRFTRAVSKQQQQQQQQQQQKHGTNEGGDNDEHDENAPKKNNGGGERNNDDGERRPSSLRQTVRSSATSSTDDDDGVGRGEGGNNNIGHIGDVDSGESDDGDSSQSSGGGGDDNGDRVTSQLHHTSSSEEDDARNAINLKMGEQLPSVISPHVDDDDEGNNNNNNSANETNPPLSPDKMSATAAASIHRSHDHHRHHHHHHHHHHHAERVNSVRARRLLWGGQLLQLSQQHSKEEDDTAGDESAQTLNDNGEDDDNDDDPADEEKKQRELFHAEDEISETRNNDTSGDANGRAASDDAGEGRPREGKEEEGGGGSSSSGGGLFMLKLVENAIQEATWKRSPSVVTSSSSVASSSTTSLFDNVRGKIQQMPRWPISPIADDRAPGVDGPEEEPSPKESSVPSTEPLVVTPDVSRGGEGASLSPLEDDDARDKQSPSVASTSASAAHLPPTHPTSNASLNVRMLRDRYKTAASAVVTPPPSATNVVVDRNQLSPTNIRRSVLFGGKGIGSPGGGGVSQQSPTRSDHSADAAAGAKNKQRIQQVRERIFGPLDDAGNGTVNDAKSKDCVNAVREDDVDGDDNVDGDFNGGELTLRDVEGDDNNEHLHSTGRNAVAVYESEEFDVDDIDNNNAKASPSSSRDAAATPAIVSPDSSINTARRASWEDNDSSSDEEFSKIAASRIKHGHRTMMQTLNLEARLSKLAVIDDRSKTFDSVKSVMNSAVSSRSDAVSIAYSFSSAAQPSVESECVRQNKEIAMEMMEGAMMDFFVGDSPTEAENAIDEDDAADDRKEEDPNPMPRRLQPLVEGEVGLFDEPSSYQDDGPGDKDEIGAEEYELYSQDVEFHRKQYELQQQQQQKQGQGQDEISVDEDEVPVNHHQEQQGPKYIYESFAQNCGTSHGNARIRSSVQIKTPLRSNVPNRSAVPPKSIQSLLMPSPSAEYEDPSVFGINSLISESSSEMAPAPAKAERPAPTQQLGLQPLASINRKELASKLSGKNKDLSTFLHQFSDHILNGCHEGRADADGSDVFPLNDSHVGDNGQLNKTGNNSSQFDNGNQFGVAGNAVNNNWSSSASHPSGNKKPGAIPQLSRAVPSNQANLMDDSFGEWGEDDPFLFEPEGDTMDEGTSKQDRLPIDNTNSGESSSVPTVLPPASTFLSAKERALIRQHDKTPLRTNTSRTRRMRSCDVALQPHWCGEASMCSIKEGIEEETWKEGNENGDNLKGSSIVSPNHDSQTERSDSVDPPASGDGNEQHDGNSAKKDQNEDDPAEENTSENDDDSNLDTSTKIIKMSYREQSKGSSLAWHSTNGVNSDELMPRSSRTARMRAINLKAGRQRRLNLLSISAHTAAAFREHFDEEDDHKRRGVSPLYRPRHNLSEEDINTYADDEVHNLEFIQEESFDENDDGDGDDDDKTDSRDDDYTHDKLLKDFKDIISKQSSGGGLSSAIVRKQDTKDHQKADEVRETENTSSVIVMKQQPSVAKMIPVTSADSTLQIGSPASSPRRLSKVSYGTPSTRLDVRETNITPGKDGLDRLSNRFLEPSGATPDKKSPPRQDYNRRTSPRLLEPPTPQQQRKTTSTHSNSPRGMSNSPRVIAPIPKKSSAIPSIIAPPPMPSTTNDGAPVVRQFQMGLDPDQVLPTIAQRRALFNKDVGGGSSRASARQKLRQPLPKRAVPAASGPTSRQQHPSRMHIHPHDVPQEPTKFKLEEKLRGRVVNGVGLKKDTASVGTSDLGSILTKEGDISHFIGLRPVPSMIFPRTHPTTPSRADDGMDSVRSSPSSMQNTYNNSIVFAGLSNKTTPRTPEDIDKCQALENDFGNNTTPRTPEDIDKCQALENDFANQVRILLPDSDDIFALPHCPSSTTDVLTSQVVIQSHTSSVETKKGENFGPSKPQTVANQLENNLRAAKIEMESRKFNDSRQRGGAINSDRPSSEFAKEKLSPSTSFQQQGFLRSAGRAENNVRQVSDPSKTSKKQEVRNVKQSFVTSKYDRVGSIATSAPQPKNESGVPKAQQKENRITTTETNTTFKNVGSTKSNHVNRDPSAARGIRTAHSVTVQSLNKNPNNAEGNNTSSAKAITPPSSSNVNRNIVQNGKMKNAKSYWSQLEANNKSSSSEKVFTKRTQHSSSKTNDRTNARQQHQIPSGFKKKGNLATGRSRKAADDASQHSSIFEAFEVAPLQTFAGGNDNPDDTSDFLNDFGVHHAFVKKGSKKVGFPETSWCAPLYEEEENIRASRLASPPPVKNTARGPSWQPTASRNNVPAASTGLGVVSEEEASDPEDAFEVMLQSRKKSRKSTVAKKQPPPPAGPPPSSVHNRKVSNSASGGQQLVNNNNSNNNSFRRIRSGWKKMVNHGGTAPSVPNQHGASVPSSINKQSSRNKMDPPPSAASSSNARSHFNKKPAISNNLRKYKSSRSWIARSDPKRNVDFTQ